MLSYVKIIFTYLDQILQGSNNIDVKATDFYSIKTLKPNLVLVQWFQTPAINSPVVQQWLDDQLAILNDAAVLVYFISDLRRGSITDVSALRHAASTLSNHPQWGGGVTFSSRVSSTLYANLFARFSQREIEVADSLEAALAALEKIEPNIAEGVDWETAIPPIN